MQLLHELADRLPNPSFHIGAKIYHKSEDLTECICDVCSQPVGSGQADGKGQQGGLKSRSPRQVIDDRLCFLVCWRPTGGYM